MGVGQIDVGEEQVALGGEISGRGNVLPLGEMRRFGIPLRKTGLSLVPITVTMTFCVLTPPAWSSSCTV